MRHWLSYFRIKLDRFEYFAVHVYYSIEIHLENVQPNFAQNCFPFATIKIWTEFPQYKIRIIFLNSASTTAAHPWRNERIRFFPLFPVHKTNNVARSHFHELRNCFQLPAKLQTIIIYLYSFLLYKMRKITRRRC